MNHAKQQGYDDGRRAAAEALRRIGAKAYLEKLDDSDPWDRVAEIERGGDPSGYREGWDLALQGARDALRYRTYDTKQSNPSPAPPTAP